MFNRKLSIPSSCFAEPCAQSIRCKAALRGGRNCCVGGPQSWWRLCPAGGEEAIELCVFVPPNYRNKIQSPDGTIRVVILNQRCTTGTEAYSRSSPASTAVGEELTMFKGFDNSPLASKSFHSLSISGLESDSTGVVALSAGCAQARVKRLRTAIKYRNSKRKRVMATPKSNIEI